MKKKLTLTDKYIEILEFADKHEEFTFEELCNNINPSEPLIESLKQQIFKENLFNYKITANSARDRMSANESFPMRISLNECFNLLEYRELNEARTSSKTATWFATGALLVSIAGFAFTILIHYGVL